MIRALSTRFRGPGDYFTGRLSLGGHLGTLMASGVPAKGIGITYGMQGSFKSVGVAIPNICLHTGPGIFFDAKGELAQRCFARRGAGGGGVRGMGQKTCVVDPLEITGLPRSRYNPLFEIAQEEDTDAALCLMMKLAEGLVRTPGGAANGENSWVYSGAAGVGYGMCAYIETAYPPELQNLETLRRLILEGEAALAAAVAAGEKGKRGYTAFDALLDEMKKVADKGRFGHVAAGQAENIAKFGDRQLGTIFGALAESTTWLDLPKFRHAVTGCDFLLREFLTERISVFVCLPLNELIGMANGFMRFFLTMVLEIMQVKNRDRLPLPHGDLLILIDEFPHYGVLPATQIGATLRDYSVRLLIQMQDMEQLSRVYGAAVANNFHGCSAFVQVMAMKEPTTLDWLVQAVGERQVRERQPDGRTILRVYPLLDRQSASLYLAARAGNNIVIRGDAAPLRLKTAPYHFFLPYWMYTPDPRHPEPWLRRKMRARAVRKAAEKQRPVGKGGK